jgi:light-independent protochlorophyllide reductase subunit B
MMGLEEHLLGMFRDDAEFNDTAPSHLGGPIELPQALAGAAWSAEAEQELHKIPFFVRGKARRNTERFAQERNVGLITIETLYDAKAHFGR